MERRTYAVDKDITDQAEAGVACAAAFAVLRPVLKRASVDVYTDYPSEMPEAVERAEAQLAVVGQERKRRSRDPRMGVIVTTEDPAWEALEIYAPWSINVDLWGDGDTDLGTLHDCGYSIVLELMDDEVAAARACLEGVAPLVPLADIHARRRAEKAERRRSLLARWFTRGGPRE